MKKMLTRNLGLKILALGFSILLWIIVVNTEDPIRKKVYTNIPVTVTHAELVTNQGKTYQVLDDSKTVSVTVRAKQRILDKIKAEDIKAIADMKSLETTTRSLIPITVTIPAYAGDYSEAVATPSNIQVSIDEGKAKTFPISATASGTVRDGSVLGKLEVDPGKVEITGPKTVVDSIEKVVAEVDVSGLSKDTILDAEMVLYDSGGKIIDATLVENNLGDEGVKVKVQLLNTKSVAVNVDTSRIQPASGYRISGVTVQPETIEIVGGEKELEQVDEINVPSEAVAVSNLDEKVEETIDITPYLPEGVRAVDEAAGVSVLVKVDVEKLGTRKIEFPVSSIVAINVAKDLRVVYGTTGNIAIVVTCQDDSKLKGFELEPGMVSINLVNYKEEGAYTVPLQITLPEGITLEEEVSVEITLEKNSGGSDDGE